MKRREDDVDEKVDRHLELYSSLPSEEMVQARERLVRRLRSESLGAAEEPSAHSHRAPSSTWRRFAMIPTAAAVILAVFIAITWRQDAFAVVESVDGTLYRVVDGKAIHVGENIDPGTPVRSDGGTGAVLKLPDGARIEMHGRSELSLEKAKDGTRIRLNTGSVSVTPSNDPAGNLYVQNREITVPVVSALFQSAAAVSATSQSSAEPRLAFEEASIRPSSLVAGGGRGGGAATVLPNGCSLVSSQVDPRRFAVAEATVYTLVTLAYGANFINPLTGGCPDLAAQNLVSGGPDWIKSDRWDIQAVIPEGVTSYTEQQLKRGDAPKLQKMILSLLEDRFKLIVRREMKEVTAYALTAEPGAPKFVVRPTRGLVPGGIDDPRFQVIWDRAEPGIPKYEIGAMWGKDLSVADLIPIVRRETGRPVLDRTGFTNPFNFFLVYKSNTFSFPELTADLPGISKALEEQIGLKLVDTKTTAEFWVIDRVEKPSEN